MHLITTLGRGSKCRVRGSVPCSGGRRVVGVLLSEFPVLSCCRDEKEAVCGVVVRVMMKKKCERDPCPGRIFFFFWAVGFSRGLGQSDPAECGNFANLGSGTEATPANFVVLIARGYKARGYHEEPPWSVFMIMYHVRTCVLGDAARTAAKHQQPSRRKTIGMTRCACMPTEQQIDVTFFFCCWRKGWLVGERKKCSKKTMMDYVQQQQSSNSRCVCRARHM